MERVVFLLLVVLTLTQAGPVKQTVWSGNQCSKTCTGSSKLNYEAGKTYRYSYETEIQSSVFGAMEDYAGLQLSANVNMEVLSKCELVMKLTDVTLKEYNQESKTMKTITGEFKTGLEKNPVRLSFQDGNIEELCLLEQEPEWVTNAKRGIISLFQTNMNDFTKNETVKEMDIAGTCDTDYSPVDESDWYTTSFSKTKRHNTCTGRHSINSAIQGVPYTANSDFQFMPIMNSEQNCHYKLNKQGRYITSVHCQESHVFRPFSRDNNGAVTRNDQKLTFIDVTSGTSRTGPSVHKVSLTFNHNDGKEQEEKTRRDLTRKLIEVCEKTKEGVRPETPRLFTELVYMVKAAEADSLNAIYLMLKKGTICKENNDRASKFFLDTLPLAGTGASLNLMTKLLTTKAVTGVEADMWLTSLAFIKNPDITILKEIKPLINMKGNEDKTLLSIGTLIHSYCRQHGNCQGDKTIRALVSALQNKMAPRCKVTDTSFKSTLMALRAIGNAGYAQSAVPTLDMCIRIKSNPVEIRLSAIEAFRRMPCTASRNSLFVILKEVEEDPEIRIAAYKSIMECPSEEVLNTVRKVLEKEDIVQVGSYIWSHLTNLMETSDRHKLGIKEILDDETFKQQYDLEMMKYSRNYEKSMFIEPLNTGAKVEGDLIFSPKSFVPRSSMMNLTVDLFGESVNLLEFGGRMEGLEHFLEAFIGPNGYFSDVVGKKSPNTGLALKSVKQDKIKRIDRRFGAKVDDLRASLYMRVFGNELKYLNFRGLDDLMTAPELNIMDMFSQLAKDNDVTFSHSTMFLDSGIVVPTGSGFPMNLTVKGTATMDLSMKGKMNFKDMDIVGYIKPSAAVDVSSVMSVDAHVTKCGIKMVSTLHTSTAVQGKVHLSPAGALTAEYEMPQRKMEIFDFKSSFFTIHQDSEKEQKMIEDNRQTKRMCSPQNLVTVTGLELCAEVSYPNASLRESGPYFPLTGPVSGGLYLYNRDTHTKYTFTAKSVHTQASNILHFDLDTPGSKHNRHVAFNMNLNKKDMSMGMAFTSPWTQADVEGFIINTKKLVGINGKLNIDGRKSYSVKTQVTKEYNPKSGTRKYTPALVIRAPGMVPINIQAVVQNKRWALVAVSLAMKGVLPKPFESAVEFKNSAQFKSLKASIDMDKNTRYSYESSMRITTYGKKQTFKPFVSVRTPQSEVLAFGGTINHKFGQKIDYKLLLDKIVAKKVIIRGNFRKLTYRRGRELYGVTTDIKSGPADIKLVSKIDNRNFRAITSDITFNYIIRGVAKNNIKLVTKFNNISSSSLTKAKGALNLNIKNNPEYNVKMTGSIDHTKKLSQIFADVSYGPNFKDTSKQIQFAFEMNRNFKTLMKANARLDTRFKFPAMNLNLVASGKHSHSDRHIDSSIYLKGSRTFIVESGLHWRDNTEKYVAMTGNYTLIYPGRNFMIIDTIEQADDQTYKFTMEVRPQKNQRHSVFTQLNMPRPGQSKVNVFSDISLKNEKPVHIEGTFDMNPWDFITQVSYQKEKQKYAGSVVSKTTRTASDLKVEMEYPVRHVMLNINGKMIKDKYSGFADFKWDVGKDPSRKVHAGVRFDEPTQQKINGSVSLSYPSRDLTLNFLHQVGAKYSTHADFQWEKNKKISAATTLGIKEKSAIGTAKLTTPFSTLPSLEMKLSHTEDNEQYLTKVNVDYDHSVNVELKLKKPLSLKTFVGYFLTTTSIKGMKRFRVDVDHKLNPKTKIDSMVKFSWNKQQITANFEIKNITKASKVGFTGDLALKTTFQYMKKGNVKLSFNTDGKTFNTAGSFKRNKKLHEFTSKITHNPLKYRYESTGKIGMSSPTGSSGLTWNHRLSAANIKTAVLMNWGKKNIQQIVVKIDGTTKDMKLAVNLDTPFKPTGKLDLALDLDKDSFPMRASIDLKKNDVEVANVFGLFDHSSQNTEMQSTLRIPSYDVDSKVTGKHTVGDDAISTEFDAVISPQYVMQANSQLKRSVKEPFTHTVVIQSSLENMKRIKYTAELLKERMTTFTTKLEYGAHPVVEFQSSHMLKDGHKKVQFLLKTPFENITTISGDVKFVGTPEKFTTTYSMKVDPLFDERTGSVTLDTTNGLVSKVRMDTFILDLNANVNTNLSDVSLNVELQPADPVTLKFSHSLKPEGSKKMTASFGVPSRYYGLVVDHSVKNQRIRSEVSLNKNDRKYTGVVFNLNRESRIESSLVVSIPAKRDVHFSLTKDGPRTHFEMNHNRNHKMTFDMDLLSQPIYRMDLKSSWQLAFMSPDEYDTQFFFEFDPSSKMASNGYITKSSIGKTEFDILFDSTRNIEGKLMVKSPLFRNIKVSFDHVIGSNYYDSKASLIHGGKIMIDGAATLNLDSSIIGDITLKSALTKKIQANMRYDGQKDNFVLRTEASYGKRKANVELSSKLSTDNLAQKLSLSASDIPDVTLELSHFGGLERFTSFGEFNHGNDKHRMDLTFETNDRIDWSVAIDSPLVHPISSRITVTGSPRNFKGHAELIRNTEKSAINVALDTVSPKLTGSLDIASPYVRNVAFSVEDTSSLPNIKSMVKLVLGKSESYDLMASVEVEPTIKSSLIISTPTDNVEGRFSHEGSRSNFKSHAEFKHNTKSSELDIQFGSSKKYEGQISLKSSYLPNELSFGFEHGGISTNFKSRAEFVNGFDRTEMNIALDLENKVFSTVSVKVPNTPKVTGVFKHTGNMKNMNTRVKYMYGDERSVGDLTIKSTGMFTTSSLSIRSPYMEDISVNMKHEGELDSFESTGDVTIFGQKSEATVKVNLKNNLETTFEVTSPRLTINVTHSGSPTDFKSGFDILNDMDRYSGEMTVLVKDTIDLSVALTSPIPDYETVNARYTHKGELRHFLCKASLELTDGKREGELNVNVKDLSDMSLDLKLLPDLYPIKAFYSFKNNNQKITSVMELNRGMDKNKVDMMLLLKDKMLGEFNMNSVHLPKAKAEFDMTKGESDFISSSKLTLDGVEKGHFELSVNTNKDLVCSFSAKVPVDDIPIVTGDLLLKVSKKFSREVSSIFVDGVKQGGLEMILDLDKQVKGSLKMDMGSDRYVSDLLFTQTETKFTASAGMTINDIKKVGLESSLSLDNGVVATYLMELPFEDLSKIESNFNFMLSKTKVIETASIIVNDVRKAGFDSSMNLESGIEAMITINLPLEEYSKINGEIKLAKSDNQISASSVISVNDIKKVSLVSTINFENGLDATVNMDLPLEEFSTFEANLKYSKSGTTFTGSSVVAIDGTKKAELSITIENGLVPTVSIKLPFDRLSSIDADVSIRQSKKMNDIKSSLSINGVKKVELISSLNLKSGYIGIFSLELPLESASKINAELSLTPKRGKHVGKAFVSVNDIKTVDVMSTLSIENGASLTFSVDLPFENVSKIETEFDFSQSEKKYAGKAGVSINSMKKIGFESSLNIENGIVTSLTLEMPFEHYPKLDLAFQLTGDLSEFDIQAVTKNMDIETFKLAGKFTSVNKISADFTLSQVTLYPVHVTVDITGSKTNFDFIGSLTNNNEPVLTSKANFYLSDKPLVTHGEFTVNLVSASYNLEIDSNLFKSQTKFFDGQSSVVMDTNFSNLDDTRGSIRLTKSNTDPMEMSFIHSLKNKRCFTKVNVELDRENIYDYQQTFNWQRAITGDLVLKTPHEEMKLSNFNFKLAKAFPFYKSFVQLTNNQDTIFEVSTDIPKGDSVTGKISLTTAYEGLKNIDVTFYHEGEWSNFKVGGKMMYAPGEDITFDFDHLLSGTTLNSRLSLVSMYTDEIVLTAYHNGPYTDFVSKYALYMGKDNSIVSNTNFKLALTSLDFSSTTKTTMSGETFVEKADLKMDGTLERFKIEARVETFGSTVRLETSFQSKPIIEGSVTLITPFKSFEEMKASFSHSGISSNFLTKGQLQYMPYKTISGEISLVDNGWRRMETTVTLKTPFEGIEESSFVYKHTGDSNGFHCEPTVSVGSSSLSGIIKASNFPLSLSIKAKTPFEGFEAVGFESNIDNNQRGRYSGHMASSWGQGNKIVVDGYVSALNNRLQGSASVTTPFTQVRRASAEFSHQIMPNKYTQSFITTFNGQNLVDLEVDLNLRGDRKHFLTTVRSPRQMKFEMSGDFTPIFVDMDMIANWNMADSKSQIKMKSGYDFRYTTKKADFKLTTPGQTITYKGEFSLTKSMSDLTWGMGPAEKTGFDLKINKNDANLKVVVPGKHARVLEFSGLYNGKVMEADFYWDAEVDRTKKFEVRNTFITKDNNMKGAVSVYVPGLQKTIFVESDVSVYRGRVVFDGELSFSFSRDERKKIVITTKLKDTSYGANSMNYSLSLGLSQPYTNVGVMMYSHVGKTNSRYSAGMGMEYLTSKRQTKTFHMAGEVNSINKLMSFEMESPLKTIHISGSAKKTDNKFLVTLVNKYDQKTPLNTMLAIRPSQKQIEFSTHYNLDEPSKTLHIVAKYVNSSALKAEVFHQDNSDRITDILATAHLNNSHLLHTRVHWRPEITEDLKAYYNMKKGEYLKKIKETTFTAGEEILEEIYDKATSIHRMVEEEIGENNMAYIEKVFKPVQFYLVLNVNRWFQVAHESANSSWSAYNSVMQKYQALSSKAQQTLASMQSPFMMPLPIQNSFDYAVDVAKLPASYLPAQSVETLKYVRHILPEQVNSLVDTMNINWELEEHFESSMSTLLKLIEKDILEKLEKLRQLAKSVGVSPFTVFDPKHGEIQAEYYLPIPLKSLDAMPVINFVKYLEMIEKYSSKVSVDMPYISRELFPPFTGEATIHKGREISTFDGYAYSLESDCTFILTKDYKDGNFTIIRSNGENPSVTIFSKTSPVEIKLSGEVFVAGKQATLPMKDGVLTVNKIGETVTVDGNDFTMRFHLPSDFITVRVNGWYFGKTGGLFGIYDNERSNDMMTSFNKVINNSNRFAKTWEVGTATCR